MDGRGIGDNDLHIYCAKLAKEHPIARRLNSQALARSLSRSARNPVRTCVHLICLRGRGARSVRPRCTCHGRHLTCCPLALILGSTHCLPCPSGSLGGGKKGPPKARSRSNGSGSPHWPRPPVSKAGNEQSGIAPAFGWKTLSTASKRAIASRSARCKVPSA